MSTKTIGLTRRQAIPLAIGSIAGSGILFLPSSVYVESGHNALLVWVGSVLLCVPMLLMFEDMVKSNPDGDGIEAFVRIGLGETFARCVPIMFISLVIVGLPSGAVVAGRYVRDAVGGSSVVLLAAAIVVLAVALAINLKGSRASNRVQLFGTWALLSMATVLLVTALARARFGVDTVTPDHTVVTVFLPTVVLAFWAFAGFENLTFLSKEFAHPKRDFLPVSVTALSVYGVFTILLTLAIALRIPKSDVDDVAGLLQLAGDLQPRALVITAVTVIAFGAMVLNAVSWVWGVSSLVVDAASRGVLPRALAVVNNSGIPRRALAVLAGLFACVLTVLTIFPTIVVDALATASAIFILMYVMCIISYVRVRGITVRTTLNAILLVVMALSLAQSGWRSVYGLIVLTAALLLHTLLSRRRARLGVVGTS